MGTPDANILFYAVLGVCAVLLVLRVVLAALRLRRLESRSTIQNHAENSRVGAKVLTHEEGILVDSTLVRDSAQEPVITSRARSRTIALRTKVSNLVDVWAHRVPYGYTVSAKMIFTFTGIIAVIGLSIIGVVYFSLSTLLTEHALRPARDLAALVSEDAPAYLPKKNAAGLRKFLRSVIEAPGVAYVLLEDRKGQIIAHSFAQLPPELQNVEPFAKAKRDRTRTLWLVGGAVYEIGLPVAESRLGLVRVALWKNQVDAEVRVMVFSTIKMIASVILLGIVVAVFLGRAIMRPISRLARTARWISLGELDTPALSVADSTEFGEISRALERMRSSVKAALVRLHQEP